jgi:hypothetical protein
MVGRVSVCVGQSKEAAGNLCYPVISNPKVNYTKYKIQITANYFTLLDFIEKFYKMSLLKFGRSPLLQFHRTMASKNPGKLDGKVALVTASTEG